MNIEQEIIEAYQADIMRAANDNDLELYNQLIAERETYLDKIAS